MSRAAELKSMETGHSSHWLRCRLACVATRDDSSSPRGAHLADVLLSANCVYQTRRDETRRCFSTSKWTFRLGYDDDISYISSDRSHDALANPVHIFLQHSTPPFLPNNLVPKLPSSDLRAMASQFTHNFGSTKCGRRRIRRLSISL